MWSWLFFFEIKRPKKGLHQKFGDVFVKYRWDLDIFRFLFSRILSYLERAILATGLISKGNWGKNKALCQ